jgi:hypothetical protein
MFDLTYPLKDAPAIGLELGFPWAAGSNACAEAAQLDSTATQAGEPVSQLRKLYLEHALLRVGVLGEYIEDQGNPIHDVALERLLKISLLGRGQVVVEDDNVDVLNVRYRDELSEFPFPYVRSCNGAFATHQHTFHRVRPCRIREERKLVKACHSPSSAVAGTNEADQHRLLSGDVKVRYRRR